MTDGFNFIAISLSDAISQEIEQATRSMGGLHTEIRPKINGQPVGEILAGSQADILLIDLDLTDPEAIKELERVLGARNEDTATLITSADASIQDIRRLIRLGIDDFIPQPFTDLDLSSALKDAISQIGKRRSSHGATDGKVVTFLRSCGGSGATSIAVQLAADAIRAGKTTGMIDFDLQNGNVALSLDLIANSTVLDILESPDRLDPSFLLSTATTHHSGLNVLACPNHFVPLEAVTPAIARTILKTARKSFDTTIIDLPHAWTTWTQSILTGSDIIVLVMEVNVVAVQRTRRILHAIRELELDDVPFILVANKYDAGLTSRQRLSEASEALDHEIDMTIRSDAKTVDEARNRGIFLKDVSERSAALKDMRALSDQILNKLMPETTAELGDIKPEPMFPRFRRK